MQATAPVTIKKAPALTRWLLRICAAWAAILAAFFALGAALTRDLVVRAVLGMALGLFLCWIIGGGAMTLALREPARRFVARFTMQRGAVFVVGATLLALIEEAITTAMTNTAPLYGVPIGAAYITASANYLEVVLYHSVVVFVPMFITWAWLLRRYAFHPATVALLYGVNGVMGETLAFGAQSLIMAGFWVYVYGLMVYLPAYSLPPRSAARAPGVVAHLLALILPILAAIPVALLIIALHPPQHQFAPITGH